MNRFLSIFTSQRGLGHVMLVAAVAVVGTVGGLAVYQYDAHKVTTSSAASVPNFMCDYKAQANCFNDNGGVQAVNNKVIAYKAESSDNHEYFVKKVQTTMCNGGKVSDNCPFALNYGLNTRYKGNQVVRFQYGTSAYCLGALDSTAGAVLKVCADPSTVFVFNTGANGTTSNYVESVRFSNSASALGGNNHPAWLCNGSGNVLAIYANGTSAPNLPNGSDGCRWEQD